MNLIVNKGLRLLVALILPMLAAGCALSPTKPPQSTLFERMQAVNAAMPPPAALPPRPHAAVLQSGDEQFMAFDASGALQLAVRDEVAQSNTRAAAQCSAGFNGLSVAYDDLLEKARQHEQLYNQLGQRWADAENDLQRQRTMHGVDNWVNRALLLLALGIAL